MRTLAEIIASEKELRRVLNDLMPFVLAFYYPESATPRLNEIVENAQRALASNEPPIPPL
jgi:hypothetical protein